MTLTQLLLELPAPAGTQTIPTLEQVMQRRVAVVTPAMDKALRALLKAAQPRDPRALLTKAPPAPHPRAIPSRQVSLARSNRAVKIPARRVLTALKTGSRVASSRKS